MGCLRLWRRKQVVPGLRMNLSKSGLSWSLGPRGAHFTVGPHGARTTVGIPGTGVFYTTYSGHHAQRATQRQSATPRRPSVPSPTSNAPRRRGATSTW